MKKYQNTQSCQKNRWLIDCDQRNMSRDLGQNCKLFSFFDPHHPEPFLLLAACAFFQWSLQSIGPWGGKSAVIAPSHPFPSQLYPCLLYFSPTPNFFAPSQQGVSHSQIGFAILLLLRELFPRPPFLPLPALFLPLTNIVILPFFCSLLV